MQKFPRRILTFSDRPERVFTAENESLDVDFFVKYRISDARRFYTSTGGVLSVANQRLGEIVKNAVVTEFGKRTVSQAISSGRAELMDDLLSTAAPTAADLGLELIDFRVKQVEFMEDVSNSVYTNMEAERARIAAERGACRRSVVTPKRSVLRPIENVRFSWQMHTAMARLFVVRAMQWPRRSMPMRTAVDADFYAFYRSINAYRRSIGRSGDLLVIDPNNEFFRFLNQSDGERVRSAAQHKQHGLDRNTDGACARPRDRGLAAVCIAGSLSPDGSGNRNA